jgi:hypothetical protein
VTDEPVGDERAADEEPALPLGQRLLRSFVTLKWVPMTAALLSLPLAATALFVSLQQPEVTLILPDQIRVVQGREAGHAYVYFQPSFVSTGGSDRIEVIRDMHLEMTPQAGGEPTSFDWDQVLRLVSDPETGTLNYEYEADAVPLLIGPRDAATPLSLFEAPDGWHFAPGTYNVRVVADRVVTGQPLIDEFLLTLSPENVAFLEQPGPEQFLPLPID